MQDIIAIEKRDPNTWNSPVQIVGVAVDAKSALDWITEETQKNAYPQGHDANWWVKRGYFSFRSMLLWGSE